MSKKNSPISPVGVADIESVRKSRKSKHSTSKRSIFPFSISPDIQLPSELGIKINKHGEFEEIPDISNLLRVYKSFLFELKHSDKRIAFLTTLLEELKNNPKKNFNGIILALNLLYEDGGEPDLKSTDAKLFERFHKAVSNPNLSHTSSNKKLPKSSISLSSLVGETVRPAHIYLLTVFLPTVHLIIQMMELPRPTASTMKKGGIKRSLILILIFLITNGYSALPKKPVLIPDSKAYSHVDYVFDTAETYTGIALSPETKGKIVGGGVAVLHFGAARFLDTLTGGATTIIGALAQISLYGMGIFGAAYVQSDVEQFYKSENEIKAFETSSEELKQAIKEHNDLIRTLVEKKAANPLLYKLAQQFSFTIVSVSSNYVSPMERRLAKNLPALGRPDVDGIIPEPEDTEDTADVLDVLTRNRQREINDLLRSLKSAEAQEAAIRRKMAHMQRVIEIFDWIITNCPSNYSIFMILYMMGLCIGLTQLYSAKNNQPLVFSQITRTPTRAIGRKRRSRKLRSTANSAGELFSSPIEFANVSRTERKYKSL